MPRRFNPSLVNLRNRFDLFNPLTLRPRVLTLALIIGLVVGLEHYLRCRVGLGCGIGYPNCGTGHCHDALFAFVRKSVVETALYVFILKLAEPKEVELMEYSWPTAHDHAVTFHKWYILRTRETVTLTVRREGYLPAAAVYGTLALDGLAVASYTPGWYALIPLGVGLLALVPFFRCGYSAVRGDTIVLNHDAEVILRNRRLVCRFDEVDRVAVRLNGFGSRIVLVLRSGKVVPIDTSTTGNAKPQHSFAFHLAEFIGCDIEPLPDSLLSE